MAHSRELWLEIRTQYEAGMGVREIHRKYGISLGIISMRAKKENWIQGKIEHIIEQKAKATKDFIESTAALKKELNTEQYPYADKIIEDKLHLMTSITHITKGAIGLHGLILKGTMDKLKKKEINELDAARVTNLQGLSVNNIAQMTGISAQIGETEQEAKTRKLREGSVSDNKPVINLLPVAKG